MHDVESRCVRLLRLRIPFQPAACALSANRRRADLKEDHHPYRNDDEAEIDPQEAAGLNGHGSAPGSAPSALIAG